MTFVQGTRERRRGLGIVAGDQPQVDVFGNIYMPDGTFINGVGDVMRPDGSVRSGTGAVLEQGAASVGEVVHDTVANVESGIQIAADAVTSGFRNLATAGKWIVGGLALLVILEVSSHIPKGRR